jgi:hypothetical protein
VAAALIGTAAALIYVLRRWQLRWGATGEEASATLAGDDIIPDADLVVTRAISVNAPADQVWPWIAQIGQGRGGFYSYDKLENLVGCDIHARTRSSPVAGRQGRRRGQARAEVGLEIAAVQPPRALVLPAESDRRGDAVRVTWALVSRALRYDDAVAVARAVRLRTTVGATARPSPSGRSTSG